MGLPQGLMVEEVARSAARAARGRTGVRGGGCQRLVLPELVRNQDRETLHADYEGHTPGPPGVIPEKTGDDRTSGTTEVVKRNIQSRSGGSGFEGSPAHMAGCYRLTGKYAGGLERQACNNDGHGGTQGQQHAGRRHANSPHQRLTETDAVRKMPGNRRYHDSNQIHGEN